MATTVKYPNPNAEALRKMVEKGEFYYLSGTNKTAKHKLGGAIKKDANGNPIAWDEDVDVIFLPSADMRVAGRRADVVGYLRNYAAHTNRTFSDADIANILAQALTAENFLANVSLIADEAARVKAYAAESKRKKAAGETKASAHPPPTDDIIRGVLNAAGRSKTKGNPYIVANKVEKGDKEDDSLKYVRQLHKKIQEARAVNASRANLGDPTLQVYNVGKLVTTSTGVKGEKSLGVGAKKDDSFNPAKAKAIKYVPGIPIVVNSSDVNAVKKFEETLSLLNRVAGPGEGYDVAGNVEALRNQMGRGSELIRNLTTPK